MRLEKDNKIIFWTLVIFSFWVFLYVNLPMTHDDWVWFSIGENVLKGVEPHPNGRYMGTLLTIILTKSYIARVIIMPIILTSISLLFVKAISNNNKLMILIMATIFIIITPKNIFSQTYSWTAGFCNYVPPIIGILLYVYFIKSSFENKREDIIRNNLYILPLFILFYLNQLYIEHVTVYFVIISILMLIYNLIKFKKVYKFDVVVLLASILGMITMFSNSVYHSIATGEDTYRSIETGILPMIKRAIYQYSSIINPQFFMNLLIISSFIAILIFVVFYKKSKHIKQNKIYSMILFVILVYPIYGLFNTLYTHVTIINTDITLLLESIFTILYWICLVLSIILLIDDKSKRFKMLFYILSIIILVAPLTVVTPIGGRNFLAPYIFLVLLLLEIIQYLYNKYYIDLNIYIAIYMLVTFMILVGFMFFKIGESERIRKDEIESQVSKNNEIIYVPKIAYDWYLVGANPTFEGYPIDQFKLYYNIPYNKKLVLGNPEE